MDNSSRSEQFQSETGRGIDSLVRPSSLFYTVSGHQTDSQRGNKYVHEILGCPSILKPSFRDLPGCTRLSVGVPSQSFRPLDKLNKTMGKSAASNQGKRHARGESKFPPIKVNAKIRHIYSQLTSSEPTTPSQPQIATISTQTDFEISCDNSEELLLKSDESSSKRDAFTCISPPPIVDSSGVAESTFHDKLPGIPPSYLSKLEDLEKITGHIVIQRFFTRADEAFGCWLEKQLGMHSKSVGVDTSENTDNIENIEALDSLKLNNNEAGISTISRSTDLNVPSSLCKMDDGVKCECFLELFKTSGSDESSKSQLVQVLNPMEQDLLSQCIAYELLDDGTVLNARKLSSRNKGLVQQTKVYEEGEENSSVQIDETDGKKRLSQASIDREVTEELTKNIDKLIIELPHEDYAIVEGEFESRKEFKAAVEKVINNKAIDTTEQEDMEGKLEPTSSGSLLVEATETSETKEDSVIEQSGEHFKEEKRCCIPDVIDVSELSAAERFALESGISPTAIESQSKVVEYLGKIDPSAAAAIEEQEGMDDFLRPGADEMSMSQGETSGQLEERKEMKRSVSADSCIGTESSGETKHGLNDSGILLDSGRAVDFDGVSETARSTITEIVEAESTGPFESNTLGQETIDQKELLDRSDEHDKLKEPGLERVEKPVSSTRLLSNKSVDESIISHSEAHSSTIQRGGSDGDTEDANQSDSDDELSSELSLRRARRASSSGMPIVTEETEDGILVDDDDEDIDEEEPLDQFDAMIENHEREKRLIRPICRKRNVSTQTTKSVESSVMSSATSRSTTSATSSTNSSFDLEFISKKYMANVSPEGIVGEKKRSYLPSGASSLNILNMKFSLGRDFESEFSIRIPNKPSPTGSGCSVKGGLPENIPSVVTPRSNSIRVDRGTQALTVRHSDSDLKSLWKDVKSKMECRVGSESHLPVINRDRDLLVEGTRMKLIAYDDAAISLQDGHSVNQNHSPLPPPVPSSAGQVTQEHEERLKRSLKRLKKILDA